MKLDPPPITYTGTDWTPFIKEFGESREWKPVIAAKHFPAFVSQFKDSPWAKEEHGANAPQFFFMAYTCLSGLTPEERFAINDWPSVRKLIDAVYFTPEAIRKAKNLNRKANRQRKAKLKRAEAALKPKPEPKPEKNPEPVETGGSPLGRFRKRAKT